MRRFLRGGRARVRHGRVRWRKGLFVVSRFVCVEGPVVVRRSLAMVSHGRPVIRHASEILLVVILRPELIGSSALGVVVVPVVIIPVASVVAVTAVLFVRPLAGEVIWSVVPRAPVGVSTRSPVPVVVVLVPVLLVLVVPLPTPHLVAVATIAELSISLPLSSVCVAEVSLGGMAVAFTWVPVHLLLGMGRGHVELLGMRIVRHVRLGHGRITAGARRLWAERLLHAGHAGHVLLLFLLLLFLRSFLMSHLVEFVQFSGIKFCEL